jgi:restriction endonuclease S subunit
MKFELVRLGNYFSLEKGASYTSANLVENSDIGLLTINAFTLGGGYKPNSEKPFSGSVKDQYMLSDGDVLVATTEQDSGLLASPLVVKIDQTKFRALLYSLDVAKVSSINGEILPRFLFNVLRIPAFRKRAAYGDTGSTVQRLPYEALYDLEIPKPPLQVQDAIIRLIDSIDEKIRTNEQTANHLENIGQTIFKSWFIDFDPVKTKMAGEKPAGMDDETATLFPESLEDSEFGPIPQSWGWTSIGQIAEVVDCLHSKKPELLSVGFPYLQLDTISDRGVLHFDKAAFISEADYKKWTNRIEVSGGDCLITNVGRVGAVSQVPDHFSAAIGRNITALRPKNRSLHQSFLIIALLSDYMKKEISRNTDSGTILEALNVRNIPKLRIPAPNAAVLHKFAEVCDPIQSQIQALYASNIKLKALRESLLPRLVSGELPIPEELMAS